MRVLSTAKPLEINHPVCLVTGDGRSLPHDITAFLSWNIEHDVYAIGRSLKAYPGHIDHYADVDGDSAVWVVSNLEKNNPEKCNGYVYKHTLGEVKGFNVAWDIEQSPWDMDEVMWHGSTSLFCALTAVAMGYERVVLAGCPLDSAGHWYHAASETGPSWHGKCYTAWLDFARSDESKRVRSLSGYTKQIVGEPSIIWCYERDKHGGVN